MVKPQLLKRESSIVNRNRAAIHSPSQYSTALTDATTPPCRLTLRA